MALLAAPHTALAQGTGAARPSGTAGAAPAVGVQSAPLPPDAPTPPPPVVIPTKPLSEALVLEANASCLDHDKLVSRVGHWLQREQVDATVHITVRGDATNPQLVAFVIERADGEHSKRTINDAPADCDQLHAALGLSIALAIDANPGEGEADAPLPDDDALLAGKPEPAYFALGAAVFGHATSGLLTDVAPALSVRAHVAFVRWLELRLGAIGTLMGGQTVPSRVGTRLEGSFQVGIVAGRVDACAAHTLAQLRLLACAGGLVGDFGTRGEGFSAGAFTVNRLWTAALGGFELQAELGPWLALGAAVDVVVPLGQQRIVVVGPNLEVVGERTLSPVAVLVGVGPIFRFF